MTVALGTVAKLALVKGATWGTAVALGTGHRAPFVSCGLDYQRDQVPNDDISGRHVRQSSQVGNAFVDGPLVISGDYTQRQHLLLAAVMMGTAGVPTTVEAGVYKHALMLTPDVQGLFLSAGLDYGGVDVYGFNSIKPTRRLIQIASGGRLDETYEFVGRGVDKTLASSGWTYNDDPTDGGTRRILHRQMVVRANASAGGALGSGDIVYPTQVEIDINRGHVQEYAQAGEPEEPVPNDWGSVTVRLTFYGMSAALLALFRDNRDTGTPLKLDAVCDHGTLLGATQNRTRAFYFPKLMVTECPNSVPGPGRLPMTVAMTAHVAASDPTGFPTGYGAVEMVDEWQNEQSANPLA